MHSSNSSTSKYEILYFELQQFIQQQRHPHRLSKFHIYTGDLLSTLFLADTRPNAQSTLPLRRWVLISIYINHRSRFSVTLLLSCVLCCFWPHVYHIMPIKLSLYQVKISDVGKSTFGKARSRSMSSTLERCIPLIFPVFCSNFRHPVAREGVPGAE